MIALTVFLIVIVIGSSALVNVHIVNKKSQDTRSILDSLSFIMEDMSRNIRTGYDYRCIEVGQLLPTGPKSCTNGAGIFFEPSDGNPTNNNDNWDYIVFPDGKLYRSTNGSYVEAQMTQMTPDEVKINNTYSNFLILGAEPYPGDKQQPLVVIRLVGTITNKGVDIPFSLQTAVSQRKNDR